MVDLPTKEVAAKGMKPRLYSLVFALLLVFLSISLYHGALQHSRLPEEDNLIWQNPAVAGNNLLLALRGVWEGGEFRPQVRPIPTLARVVEHAAWDYDRGKYQMDQIFLHGIVGIFVFLLVRRWLRSALGGGLAALVFVAHPGASQSVLYLGGLSEILCGIFSIGCLLAIPRGEGPTRGRMVLIGALALLAMLSKEVGYILPVAVAGSVLASGIEWRWAKKLYLPLAAATVAAIVWRVVVLATLPEPIRRIPAVDPVTGIPLLRLIPAAIAGLAVEAGTVLLPIRLNHDDSWLLVQRGGAVVALAVLGIAFVAAGLWLAFRRGKDYARTGLALFAILPLIGAAVFPRTTGTLASDRNLYLALVGCAGLLPLLGACIVARRREIAPVLVGVSVGLVVLYGLRTHARTADYVDGNHLLQASLAVRADNPQIYYEMGNEKLTKTDYVGAADLYKKALGLRSDFPLASVNLGAAYLGQEDLGMALRTLDPVAVASKHIRALRLIYAKANYHAGIVLMKQERYKEAAVAFERMLLYYPDSFGARLNLGLIYIKAPHYAERGFEMLRGVLKEEQDPVRRAAVEKSIGKAEGLMREYLDKKGALPPSSEGVLGEPWKIAAEEGM